MHTDANDAGAASIARRARIAAQTTFFVVCLMWMAVHGRLLLLG
jgi:hypothetical protein